MIGRGPRRGTPHVADARLLIDLSVAPAGGAKTFVNGFTEGLLAAGVSRPNRVILLLDASWAEENRELSDQLRASGFTVVEREVADAGTWRGRLGRGSMLRAVRDETSADIVFLPRESAPRLSTPYVVMARNLYAWERSPERLGVPARATMWLLRQSARRSARGAAEVIAVSRAIADRVPRRPTPPIVIPHGCDLDEGEPVRPLPGRPLRVMMMAAVMPHKGMRTVIDATALLRDRHGIDVELTIFGPIADEGLAAELGRHSRAVLGRDVLAGPVPHEARGDAYRAADVVAVGSSYESFCLPLVEGMRSGRAVWAPDCTLVRETCGAIAVTYPEGSAGDAASALATALPTLDDRGRRGIERADGYRWDRVATQVVDELTRAGRSRPAEEPDGTI